MDKTITVPKEQVSSLSQDLPDNWKLLSSEQYESDENQQEIKVSIPDGTPTNAFDDFVRAHDGQVRGGTSPR